MLRSMILSIPYQSFEIENIQLAPFKLDKNRKPIARLSYHDPIISFHDVSILTPVITVIDYNPENSRLRLDLSRHFNFQIKLNTLYEYLISTIYIHQGTFLNQLNVSHEEIRNLFYFIMDGSILSLYIYPTALVKREKMGINASNNANNSASNSASNNASNNANNSASNSASNTSMRVADLKPGDTIRCIITFQGISQIMNKNSVRLRLHHSVPSMYCLD
jgi:hypothetical protein